MTDILVFPKFSYPAQDTPEKLADQMIECGVDGIDIQIRKPSWCKEDDYFQTLPSFLKIVRGRGLKCYAVTTDWTHAQMPKIEEAYRLFADNGIAMFRFWMQNYRGPGTYREDLKTCRASLETLEKLSLKHRVKALIQTHGGTLTWSPEAAWRLVDGLNPVAIGIHYDPGNMLHQEGWTEPAKAIDVMGEYLSYVVAKNVGWFMVPDPKKDQRFVWRREWTRLAFGMVDWEAVLRELKKANFKGPICMHNFYEATQEGLVEGTKADAQFLREALRKV